MAVNLSTLIILLSIFLRCSVSLYGYSGEGSPPMYGDYEAQRHWMEITYNLDIKDWYFNSTENDLLYWGLDYPPLTAYHSWLCGAIANYLNPEFVELTKSRGFESPEHKLFMRFTVIVADLLTFMAGAVIYSILAKPEDRDIQLLILLAYPGLILIDHGHFQYNCVSLGLALYSIIATIKGFDTTAAILFCLSLSYKQMILYYSLPIFFYYLGICKDIFFKRNFYTSFVKFFCLALSVIFSIFIVWLPFMSSYSQLAQVLHRLFPLERGIFEDKVSNFWCIANVIFKFRNYMSNEKIAMVCAILTLLFSIPSCIDVFKTPIKDKYILATINTSLAFFIFSYQVHEKTILLVALPVMLYFNKQPLHCFWLLNISTLSMLPLFLKDKLLIPFLALNLLFLISVYAICHTKDITWLKRKVINNIFVFSLIVGFVLALIPVLCSPPRKYPDLFSLLISVYCGLHFMYFLIYFTKLQLTLNVKLKTY
ncbi:dolichyl pyrophosphate Man9GlcNAc2 alpha-1,3-glucosyltransferase [Cimex lectularius]|uniref:Alpha-1,3-glucosyltransferase n=1 Tax=Cimex lectularius TaxID=79782 RepID=A0A8I6SAM8_CIMLE|nr:dolichyl pyrophosphate Man9GlcNAc2 alpha-1,3-glucosyltransferase [Cimex lectularius]XP_014259686.1 dolichyl pyrophosphate Man9GlcNAc2 alpha-1,3-glucosyltransferase [Cimex lectularius]